MSANLNEKDGKVSFAYNKRRGEPWHKTGTAVDGAMTSQEAIELAGLNYDVRMDKVAVVFPKDLGFDKSAKYVPATYATYRTDTLDVFGIVSNQYQIVQNSEAFEFIDDIVGDGKAVYETAGALGKGERVFMSVKLPYYIKIDGHDTIENYLVVSNGHDGKNSLSIFLTPIRVVCANTLCYGMSVAKLNVNIRHTGDMYEKISDARELLNISKTVNNDMEHLFKKLAKTQLSDREAVSYFNNIILNSEELSILANTKLSYEKIETISSRKKNVLNKINTYYHTGVGQDNIIGTAFGVYNAVTGYMSNIKKYSNNSRKMESLVLGGSDFKLNEKALNLAVELI